ncbi:sulfatase [bacterium]|nr:sulfatase [bacterium]MBU1073630.1 sulfatase [bacterium]MBU1676067.1 sulfatase [bacterium]
MRRYTIVFLLALTTLQCARPRPEPEYLGPVFGPGPRRVVVVSLDCLRADHLGCYGYPQPTSPRLDALCEDSVRFARATAPYNWTLPSHTSLFTGLYARGHGVRKENQAVSPEIPNLVEPLREAGFATAAFTGGAYMARRYGHARGFDTFWSSEEDYLQWAEILERGEDWLTDHADEDAFLFLHTYEIHMPYQPPIKYLREILGYHRTKFMGGVREVQNYLTGAPPEIAVEVVGRYDAGILYTDDLLGGFIARLDAAGLADNMLLIVTSDHGEAFWEHGRWGHNGDLLGPQLTDVPLIVRLPRTVFPAFAGKIVEDEVSFLDIMPTVLDAVGVEPGSDIDGFSLLPELIGRPVNVADAEARERRTVKIDGDETLLGLCESRNYVSLRAGGWSVVVPGPTSADIDTLGGAVPYQVGIDTRAWPALYRIAQDPWELEPLPLEGKTAAALSAAAARLAGRPGERDAAPSEIQIPPGLRRRLQALGYL